MSLIHDTHYSNAACGCNASGAFEVDILYSKSSSLSKDIIELHEKYRRDLPCVHHRAGLYTNILLCVCVNHSIVLAKVMGLNPKEHTC